MHVVSAFEPLRGAHVTGAPEGAAKVWQPLPDDAVEGILSQAVAGVRLARGRRPRPTRSGDPVDALIEVADKVGATMIVVGSKGMHGAAAPGPGQRAQARSRIARAATC